MKIYTSEIHQFGKELKILNEKVKFDKLGCAEVSEDFGKKIIEYSEWYSQEKHEPKIVEKKKSIEDEIDDTLITALKFDLEKAKKQDESRISKIKSLEKEIQDIREDMEKVVSERDQLKISLENKESIYKKEKEQLEYKYQLAFMNLSELREMCSKLELKEDDYKKADKANLVEMIINAAE